jgi:dTDP-4-amino-4,6-dideoxygalactose transaminase
MGYDVMNYPITYDNFSREISLPVFYNLTIEQIQTVCEAVESAVEKVIEKI